MAKGQGNYIHNLIPATTKYVTYNTGNCSQRRRGGLDSPLHIWQCMQTCMPTPKTSLDKVPIFPKYFGEIPGYNN